MKIMILAIGRSGTTALLHKMGAALPGLKVFSGGKPDKVAGIKGDAIFKFTYSETKGRTFDLFREHLRQTDYDRKIWLARDPRDNALSRFLFRWYRGSKTTRDQYRAVLELVEKKERNPASVDFCELMRYRGQRLPPFATVAEVIEDERYAFTQMHDFVSTLGNDWFIFKYEDLLENNFAKFNEYLGFEIKTATNIDKSTLKVARKKSTGDWRHWYTEEDVKLLRPVYTPYMNLIGYDSNDWTLHEQQVIEPKYASLYLKGLPKRRRLDSLKRFRSKLTGLLSPE
jgi:hypothetical protein